MNVLEVAKALSLSVVVPGEGESREIKGIYCCDLLSIVMGRAKPNDAWITVMSNVNAIAVAVLADISCIILSEGMAFDKACIERAEMEGVCVLSSDLPTFELSRKIDSLLKLS